MSKVCAKCNNSKRGKEFLFCFGSCNKVYHVDCLDSKFTSNDTWIKTINDCPYAVFMCTQCQRLSNDERYAALNLIKSSLDNLDTKVTALADSLPAAGIIINQAAENLANSCTATISSVCSKIGDQIADQIRDCFAQTSMVYQQPASHLPETSSFNSLNARPSRSGVAASIIRPSYASICGSKPCSLPDTIKVIKPKFWFHLSQFDTSVDDTAIANFVNDTLNISNAAVTRLIPNGRVLADLEYVCFKVGVDADLEGTILATETWPNQLTIRPFRNSISNFRQRNIQTRRRTPPATTPLEVPVSNGNI